MKKFRSVTIIFLLAVSLFVWDVQAKPASVQLQDGLYAEEIDGDLDAAMKIYEQIIAEKGADEQTVAQAMYRLGTCQLKKKDEQQARATFEKLVAQFPGQSSIVEKVKPLLEDLANHDPAVLMPPDTKIYIELGSPGRQIETILNMLKGTPFENPLAAIGGGQGQSGQKSPGDIMAALLNPSMMAEFKKIRGMAIGLGSVPINVNNPPVVAVLYPGKSDALRGIILMGLGMVGKQSEAIEGMQTLIIENRAGAVYDDNVIIIAQPLERLRWCAKQHKGITNEPTLVSQNKTFAKLSKTNRQANAVTIWMDGDTIYAVAAKQSGRSELQLIDGMGDLKNIQEIVSNLSIATNGIFSETSIGFKEGHRCLAYDLIRTPNLSRAGFEAVPDDAIALVSLALGEVESSRVETVQKTIKRLTGLDVGREIFANIEQINVFVLPPGAKPDETMPAKKISPVLNRVGLVMTSHNPEQTGLLFSQLLTAANLANASKNEQAVQQVNPAVARYNIGLVNNQPITCYMGQAGKSTVLALSPDVAEACLSAVKNRKSVLTAGALSDAINNMPSDTSKLVLVNVAGAIRNVDNHFACLYENPQNPVHKQIAQLAQACEKTKVQIRTGESPNSFNIEAGVSELPSLDAVFPLLMQIRRSDIRAKVTASLPNPADKAVVGIGAKLKLSWATGINAKGHKIYFGTSVDNLPLLTEVTSTQYTELGALKEKTTYYWRVDETQADGSVIDGSVWSFTTGSLVGWWKLDDGSGSVAVDSSAGHKNGTLTNMDTVNCWVIGHEGKGLYFDGINDYVSIPALNLNTNHMTIAAWIKTDGPQGNWTGVVFNGEGTTCAGINIMENKLRYHWNRKYWDWVSGLAVPNNQWVLVGLGVEPTKATMYLVQDGVVSSATNFASHSPEAFDGVTRIGHDPQAPEFVPRFFKGTIDDVRIYDYALSKAEVADLFKAVYAIRPNPADGQAVTSLAGVKLRWSAGIDAAKHKVYFGTDPCALSLLAETTSPDCNQMPPLKTETIYYWRVDEAHSDGSIVSGKIWSFNTSRTIGWWKFDEGSGPIATNSATGGRSGNGTLNNMDFSAARIPGIIGTGALNFDGVNDCIVIPPLNLTTNNMTITAWIKRNGPVTEGVSGIVFSEGALTFTGLNLIGNELRYHWGGNFWGLASGLSIPDNKWCFVSMAVQPANTTLYVGVDGKISSVTNGGWNRPMAFNEILCIGSCSPTGRFFKGAIDDVRIYKGTLSGNEISEIYQAGAAELKNK